jgi:adenylate kinase
MSTINFQTALSLRKWIRANCERLHTDAARLNVVLGKEDLLRVSKACQDAIIPGMPTEKVRPSMILVIEKTIKAIIAERPSSSNSRDKESPPQIQVDPEAPTL